eukprot:CAMPEP_0206047276 /NCGR_PEP_ID=MMETSP1466-20131121/20837_1 /ASSEMBLY_ACC=CAM_ASM_001126 /TAXON_ID=44452 /ORGANISM="Pavlova gyrans, Strain CCMP608" /LENGTH=102 /DNA_ID=CAMNT_0053422287 /DNA_START=184 /DNA_END=493 /DNA_ORIENTATION=-
MTPPLSWPPPNNVSRTAREPQQLNSQAPQTAAVAPADHPPFRRPNPARTQAPTTRGHLSPRGPLPSDTPQANAQHVRDMHASAEPLTPSPTVKASPALSKGR